MKPSTGNTLKMPCASELPDQKELGGPLKRKSLNLSTCLAFVPEVHHLFAEPNNMKTRITQLQTGEIPYEAVFGQLMGTARCKRVAAPERTRRPAETEEPEFINMPDIRTGSFGSNSSFDLRIRNRFSFNENQ